MTSNLINKFLGKTKLVSACAVLFWVSAICLYWAAWPNLEKITYVSSEGFQKEIPWPFSLDRKPERPFTFNLTMTLARVHPTKFTIYPNCPAESLKINGQTVRSIRLPGFSQGGETLDVSSYLHPGQNQWNFMLGPGKETVPMRIQVAPTDPLRLLLLFVVLLAVASTIIPAQRWTHGILSPQIALILFVAVALRIVVFSSTPYFIRSYDWAGHLEYIKYIASHLILPPTHAGWETHQPPFYYILMGLWMGLTGQASTSFLYAQWQLASLLMSIGIFGIGIWIARLIFPNENDCGKLHLFLWVLAALPALVFYSSRISNDVIFGFISFVWLAMLLLFWREQRWKDWLWLSLCLGVALLAKNTAMVLIPISCVCLAAARRIKWPDKIKKLAVCVVILLATNGWFQIPRAMHESDAASFVVPNTQLDEGLRINRSISNLLTFDPVGVFEQPFNDPRRVSSRRDYFPEFFFKSAFFGEWSGGDYLLFIARILLICTMLILPFGLLGVITMIRCGREFALPLCLTFFSVLGAQMFWVWTEPYGCSEDFRYFVFLIIPIAFFCLEGMGSGKLRPWIKSLLSFTALNSGLYLLMLCLL